MLKETPPGAFWLIMSRDLRNQWFVFGPVPFAQQWRGSLDLCSASSPPDDIRLDTGSRD